MAPAAVPTRRNVGRRRIAGATFIATTVSFIVHELPSPILPHRPLVLICACTGRVIRFRWAYVGWSRLSLTCIELGRLVILNQTLHRTTAEVLHGVWHKAFPKLIRISGGAVQVLCLLVNPRRRPVSRMGKFLSVLELGRHICFVEDSHGNAV